MDDCIVKMSCHVTVLVFQGMGPPVLKAAQDPISKSVPAIWYRITHVIGEDPEWSHLSGGLHSSELSLVLITVIIGN